nr:restriction endonuclease [Sedimentibacter sp.]
MTNDKNMKRIFVKEALGSRKYFSYRTDLILYKILLSIIVLTAMFFMTSDIFLSVLFSAEVFAVFTLINKMNMERKKNEGKNMIFTRIKKDHFKKKLSEINTADFELLIGYLLEIEGWKNYIKKGNHMYLAEKDGIICCIKIFKLLEENEVEKTDIRSMIEFMGQNSIRTGYLVVTGSMSQSAAELLEKFKHKLHIKVLDVDELYDRVEKQGMLPEDENFMHQIFEEKKSSEKEEIKNNVFSSKKTIVYLAATVFFYFSSKFIPDSIISRYIFYYFVVLSVLSILYMILPGDEEVKKAK